MPNFLECCGDGGEKNFLKQRFLALYINLILLYVFILETTKKYKLNFQPDCHSLAQPHGFAPFVYKETKYAKYFVYIEILLWQLKIQENKNLF